ncbi:MAG: MBL fold metallo-hydrolase [Oscillospiraceae bacterium]
MLIKTIPVGNLETNCYIVSDGNTLNCAVIDPGDESNTILNYIEENKLRVEAIFITHGHFDHTTAASAVQEETGAPIWINGKDILESGSRGFYKFRPTASVNTWGEGTVITIGSMSFTVMETPGHSPGSVTLVCENVLFTGDTLFRDSCGRTDLPGGSMEVLMDSLRKLAALPGDYEVYPGHMDATSLDRERNFNYYVRCALEEK